MTLAPLDMRCSRCRLTAVRLRRAGLDRVLWLCDRCWDAATSGQLDLFDREAPA